jgi:chromosome segregation ATPase
LQALHGEAASQRARIIELEVKLAAHERVFPKLQPETSAETQLSLIPVEVQLTEARQKLEEVTSLAQKTATKYKHQLATEKQSKEAMGYDKMKLENVVASQDRELLALKKSLANVSAGLVEAKHHLDIDGHIIAGIQNERDTMKKLLEEKTVEVNTLKKKIELVRKECESVKEEKRLFEEKHKDCQQRLDVLRRENETVKEEKRILEEKHMNCPPPPPQPAPAQGGDTEDLSQPIKDNNLVCAEPILLDVL